VIFIEGLFVRYLVIYTSPSPGTLVRRSNGFMQNRLLSAGYYHGQTDGIFGKVLEDAVKIFQKDHRLPVTGQIGFQEYVELGLIE
jgi:hypothetical protein